MKSCIALSLAVLACLCLASDAFIVRRPLYRPRQQRQQPRVILVRAPARTAPTQRTQRTQRTQPTQPTQAPVVVATKPPTRAANPPTQRTAAQAQRAAAQAPSTGLGSMMSNALINEQLDLPPYVNPGQALMMQELDLPYAMAGLLSGSQTGGQQNNNLLNNMILAEQMDFPQAAAFGGFFPSNVYVV